MGSNSGDTLEEAVQKAGGGGGTPNSTPLRNATDLAQQRSQSSRFGRGGGGAFERIFGGGHTQSAANLPHPLATLQAQSFFKASGAEDQLARDRTMEATRRQLANQQANNQNRP